MKQTVQKNYITQRGKQDIQEEYEVLVKVKRPEVILRLQQTREMGDTENSAYDDAREEQALLEARIDEIEKVMKSAVVVSYTDSQPDFVVIGSTVVCEMNGEIHEFTIVGSVEADPARGNISNESPVGRALLGTKVDEVIEVAIGPVRTKVKNKEIRYSNN